MRIASNLSLSAESASRSDHRRTGQPVRRDSREAGRCEALFWRATSRAEAGKILAAARRYELVTRKPGARNGALGHVALEILDVLAKLVDYRTGRLDPSIETIMRRCRRSRDAVVRGLAALRSNGFLDWLRRYMPTGNEGPGPRVQQTSNAYRMTLPERAVRLLGRMLQPAPTPDDFSHAQEERQAALEAYRRALLLPERPLFDGGNDPLAVALSRWGTLIMERESAEQTESNR